MNQKFDLFAGLAALGAKDSEWFDSLSPEGQKAAAPFVMARWMTGTADAAQIVRINTFVNPYLFAGTADKGALFKLLAASATGKTKRYQWIKGPGAKSKTHVLEVIKQYYECSTREAALYEIAAADLLEMAEELGWDKEELTKLKKELDDGSGSTTRSSTKPAKTARGRAGARK
jgi:hypothetical protein